MATNTSKYLLKKPAYSDTADIGDINDNMDSIDSILFDHAGSIAVICMGNVCGVSVPTGQYVLLQKSMISGRADGLYTAAKAIPANTVIDSSYLTAVSGGGLNSVYSALNSKITTAELLSGSTLDNLKSALTSKLDTMSAGGRAYIEFRFNGTFAPFKDTRYVGNLYKPYATNTGMCELYGANGGIIQGECVSGTWNFSNMLKHKTITGNTDQNGIINTQTTKSQVLAVFVTSPINAFAVNEAGNNVRIYAGNNSSTTSDTLKMLTNTSVTINVVYYE